MISSNLNHRDQSNTIKYAIIDEGIVSACIVLFYLSSCGLVYRSSRLYVIA